MTKNFRPLLAETLIDHTTLKFPLLVSPKLDGIRCLIIEGKPYTRTLKPLPNRFITKVFEDLNIPPNIILDGELIIPKTPFNDIQSAIMSHYATPIDFEYHVFDLILDENYETPYHLRLTALQTHLPKSPYLKSLPQNEVYTITSLLHLEDYCYVAGYEGIMLRDPNAPYKKGRSTLKEGYLIKMKRFKDAEATIINLEEMLHNNNASTTNNLGLTKRSTKKANLTPANTLGKFKVRDLKTEQEFHIGTGEHLTLELRKHIWENKDLYIGKIIKYKYQELGNKNLPRFPTFIGFRDIIDI